LLDIFQDRDCNHDVQRRRKVDVKEELDAARFGPRAVRTNVGDPYGRRTEMWTDAVEADLGLAWLTAGRNAQQNLAFFAPRAQISVFGFPVSRNLNI
jgi:hypothetical protein